MITLRILRALWWKEARDHRVLVITCALFYAAILLGAKLVLGDGFDANLRVGYVHPAGLLVVAAALAAEALAHDAASGVEVTLARLSLSRRTLWTAKASFVLAALAGFELFAFALEHALRAFEPQADTARLAPLVAWWFAALVVVACVLAAASLVRRALPAALIGCGVPVLLGWLCLCSPRPPFAGLLTRIAVASGPLGVACVAACALAIASLAAYSVARFDRFGLRRAGAFVLGGLAVMIAPLGWAVASAHSRLALAPHADGGNVWQALPSPDGRYVALVAERTCKLDRDWPLFSRDSWLSSAELSRTEVWIVERATGACRELADDRCRAPWASQRRGWSVGPWTNDGRLLAVSTEHGFGVDDERFEFVDPSEARMIEEFGADEAALESAAGVPPRWYHLEVQGDMRVLSFADGTHGTGVARDELLALSPEEGVYFVRGSDDALLRRNLRDGSERSIGVAAARTVLSPRVSPDGRWLALQRRDGLTILDAHDGRVVFGPEPGVLVEWSRHGRLATLESGTAAFAVELDGTRHPLPRGWPLECGSDGFVWRLPERITWRSLDGTRVETVYSVR
ncbi:MAG: hypothetical protein L6Q99_13110 [Planctomycetes bacterium]|nr:hypothetical protein [Planctomycetota bacterium]